ncbi:multiple sugar transport system permease protein [Thermocatellispora tengchongensis]|uniref:Multiple sugar transport system permease protein n=1 Tax=Thermocatellispora tengchongensis TaxID=1073253 RepID=A0A840P637_9ACTN|nr:carbohydrate ABC transporter permease [Thermocatellispora tengchongensis]MBB5136794.1 multiple sugar transport system permease protein [Thermocatellispora tengchongensis]
MKRTLLHAVLLAGAFVSVFPYLLVVLTAFKSQGQLNSTEPWLPGVPPTGANLARILEGDFPRALLNTVLMTAVLTAGQLVFTTFAAYAFARLRFRGREPLFWLYLATMMVPGAVTVIPLFLIMRELGLVNTWWGLLVPFLFGTPYGIFLMRQFFRGLPAGLEEAARIDGAGPLTILLKIMLPLCRPALGTLAIITVISSWNSFLWPLIITSGEDTKVITVAMATLKGGVGVDYNLLMAGGLIALVPMVAIFIFFQRHIVRSVVLTGLK